jgi:hypothetical protein
MFDRIRHGRSASPVSSTTAAAVSSQEVSTPRILTSVSMQDLPDLQDLSRNHEEHEEHEDSSRNVRIGARSIGRAFVSFVIFVASWFSAQALS